MGSVGAERYDRIMNGRRLRSGLLVCAACLTCFALWPITATANEASMRPRFDLLFRIGFAGKIRSDPGVGGTSVDADSSPGVDLRGDIPVAKYVTLGPQLSVYAVRADFPNLDRNPVVDVSPFIKGRYPFRAGKKKAEAYGLFQVGLSMVFLRESTGASDRFGPGWNIGLTPGFQILLRRRFGLLTELGWLRTQGNFTGGNLILNQGVWRIGFVF